MKKFTMLINRINENDVIATSVACSSYSDHYYIKTLNNTDYSLFTYTYGDEANPNGWI